MARKGSEKEHIFLEKYLADKLDDLNIFNFHGNPENLKGFPDRIIMTNKIIAVELKLGKENRSYYKQTPMQKKWENQFTQTNNEYYLISDREDIDKLVNEIYEDCKKNGVKNYFSYDKNIV